MSQRMLTRRACARTVAVCLASVLAITGVGEAQQCIATTAIGAADDVGSAVLIQPDGRIVVGGYYDTGGANLNDVVAVRYNADLRLDSSFDSDGIATMHIWGSDAGESIALQPDGKVVVGGISNWGGAMGCCDQFSVTRFNSDGSPDLAGFGAATGHVTTSIAPSWDLGKPTVVQPDGKILIAGIVDDGAGNWNLGLIRYLANGSLDPAFNPGGIYGITPNVQSKLVTSISPGDDYANAMLLQPDGKIVVGGATWNGTDWDWALVRYQADGNLDATFGTGGIVTTDLRGFDDWGSSIVLQADGKIVMGSKSSNGTDIDFAVARYLPDGSLDTSFGTNGMTFTPIGSGDDDGETATLQADGKIVLAGSYWNGTDADAVVVRYNTDGSLDTTFGTGGIVTTPIGSADDRIHGVTVQTDGKIVVAGDSDNGSNLDVAMVRYLPNGDVDQSCGRYRSSGTSGANLNAASRTVEITGTTATFSGPMPDNIGVGDVLQYQVTATYYLAVIHGRVSSTVYTVFATDGTTPQAAAASTAVEVYRAYTSLSKWEVLDENDSLQNVVENFDTSTDLVTADTTMNVACYADGPDGYVDVDGWNTGPDNFIRIFAPALPTEVGVSQRHAGVWDTNKFRIENTEDAITLRVNYARIDGLQLHSTDGDVADYAGVEIKGSVGASEYHVSNSIIRGTNGTADIRIGINLFSAGSGVMKAWNNVIYDWIGGTGGNLVTGIIPDDPQFTFYLYNNTVVENDHGIDVFSGTVIAKNNLLYGNVDDTYFGTFNASSSNNLAGPFPDPSIPGTSARNGVGVTFVNAAADDFHLAPADVGAQTFGADLSGDANLAFTDDIDLGVRTAPWDIGADQEGAALGAIALEDHTLTQIGDRFTTVTPLTDTLFRFRLTRAGAVNIDTLRLSFTTLGGVVNADVTAAELWADSNNDGIISGGDTLIQSGVTPSGGVITFTTNFQPSTTGTNYVVGATVANLVGADTTTLSLDPADIDPVELGVFDSGAVTNAVHTQDTVPGLTLADHFSGQVSDRFTTSPAVTEVLYQLRLIRSGVFDVTNLRVNFTTANGVASGDVTAGELWDDANDNGVVDGGDSLVQGGVAGAGGVLTFTTDFTPATTGTHYLVRATVSNLAAGDFTTFSVATADIDESAAVAETGAISDAVHAQDLTSCSPAFNYFTTAIDVSPGVANSWQDVDVSGSVPAGATGVILQWRNANTGGSDYDYGVRKKGSTDAFFPSAAKSQQQQWVMIGLDANRIFQAYHGHLTDVKTWLIGYTMNGVTFLDNRIDKSLGSAGAWLDVDISADTGADTAIGAIFLVNNTSGSSRMFGLRKNGSTDNRVTDLRAETLSVGIIGVDGSEIAEMNIEDLNADLYLVGYVTSGAVFFTNAVNKSTGTTGSYVDVDITADIGADDANGALLEISPSDNTPRLAALRANGAGYDLYEAVSHGFAAIGVDGANLFEQKIELNTMDLYLVGYSLGSCAAPTTNYRSIGTAADSSTGTVAATNGSAVVVGSGTSWQSANRGRGDRIVIDGSDYTVLAVNTDTQLTLTTPFAGVTGVGKAYTLSRQFATLQTWETCISGGGGCTFFPVVGGDLVSDDRREVGIAYNDSVFTADFQIDGSTTDATHTITLTVDDGNRHYGIPGQGARLDNSANLVDAVRVRDDFVTVEWLEVFGGSDPAVDGVHVQNVTNGDNHIVLRTLLIHDIPRYGIVDSISGIIADIYNNIIYNADRAIRLNTALDASASVRIMNNTAYNLASSGAISSVGGASDVLLRNNIAHTGPAGVISISNLDANSRNNLASDVSGTAHSPAGGGQDNVLLAAMSFVNAGAGDLHINPGSAAADAGFDLSSLFSFDIDGGARQALWDVGADDVLATTAVDLIRFVASPLDAAVELSWETGTEIDNLGFHVYRAVSAAGPYQRLTASPIPGLGNSPVGARYSYRDTNLENGTTYFYELEDIETTGVTELHGPVPATPQLGASPPSEEDPSSTASGVRVTYGDPGANALRVLREGRNFVELELRTEGFYAIPQDDGTVVLDVPGFDLVGQAGTASIPAKHHWVEALAGRQVELRKVSGRMEPVTASWSVASEAQELVASASGTVQPRARRARLSVNAQGLFPRDGARLAMVGFQEEKKKALVELAPLRWRAETGELFLTRRLVVRLSFEKVDDSELDLGGRGGRRRVKKFSRSHGVLARLATVERALYGVRYEDVFGAGRASLPTDTLRLSRQGESAAFHVEPDPSRFGPGATLYFLSEGAGANPYGNEAVFELSLADADSTSVRMESVVIAPTGQPSTFFWKTVNHEINQYYQASLLDAPDLWLWDLLLAPVAKSYPFQVTALAGVVEPARVEVLLQGTSNTPAAPDHHVRISINSVFLTEASWNGKAPRTLVADIGPGVLLEGDNVLEIENVGDTEASYSTVMLDRFTVVYPRRLLAEAGELRGAWTESGAASIGGVGASSLVLDITDASVPLWLSERGSSFPVEAGRSYVIVDEAAVRAPEVRRPSPVSLARSRNRADYIVLGPRAFVEAATPLLVHRAEQGLVSKGVAIEDVFAEFGHGESSPEAIRDFLEYAYHEWKAPSPRYVVLLGDASYDYKNYGQLGGGNPVPPLMVKTSYLWTVSDPAFAAVNGDDLLPDLAIGRLPAASIEEVHALVNKILAWESAEYGLGGPAVLVADNPDAAGDFVADAESALRRLPSHLEKKRVFLGELGTAGARDGVRDAFDAGASLMSYIGHGGIHLWADENFFNTSQIGSLAPQPRQPILLTMNCLNGYFHFPYFGSLSEELLKVEGKGIIAAFSPSGLSVNGPAQRFHHAMLDELYSGEHTRLGDAVLAAQRRYVDTGAFPELLSIYHLLGDPALTLRLGE